MEMVLNKLKDEEIERKKSLQVLLNMRKMQSEFFGVKFDR